MYRKNITQAEPVVPANIDNMDQSNHCLISNIDSDDLPNAEVLKNKLPFLTSKSSDEFVMSDSSQSPLHQQESMPQSLFHLEESILQMLFQ